MNISDWHKVNEGDYVQLRYLGNHRVPKCISGYYARVIKRTVQDNLVVQSLCEVEGKTRVVCADDVSKSKTEEEFKKMVRGILK